MHLVRWFMLLFSGLVIRTQIISAITDFYSSLLHGHVNNNRSFTEYVSKQSLQGCGAELEQLKQNGARERASKRARRGMEGRLEGLGLDEAAQLETSHIGWYILFSVSYGSTLTRCSQNTCFSAENRICFFFCFVFKPAILLCVCLQNDGLCKKVLGKKSALQCE